GREVAGDEFEQGAFAAAGVALDEMEAGAEAGVEAVEHARASVAEGEVGADDVGGCIHGTTTAAWVSPRARRRPSGKAAATPASQPASRKTAGSARMRSILGTMRAVSSRRRTSCMATWPPARGRAASRCSSGKRKR